LRIADVAQLGAVFEKILAHVDHDLRASKFERDSPKRRPEFRQTMSAAAKTVTRDDFHSLFRIMTENDKIRSPTAQDVADYLRLGDFEWAFLFGQEDDGRVFCKTCGDCCV
jgi:aromatic ring-opening dioxygenase catalytic subunit (LigB family)